MTQSKYLIDEKGRECTLCLEYKSWGEYHKKTKASTGHSARCKECSKLYYPEPVEKRKNQRMIKQRKWVCIYDPDNIFDGSFSTMEFELGLESGIWPHGSCWHNRSTEEDCHIIQYAKPFKNKIALMQFINRKRSKAKREKLPVAERQGYV